MKIRPSDLYIRQECSNFAIYVDPLGGEWYYDKKQKNVSEYPTNFDNHQERPATTKTEAKKQIIDMIFSGVNR